MQGIFIALISFAMCIKPYMLELLGLFLTVGGVACMLLEPSLERVDGVDASRIDYFICILCCLASALFLLMSNKLARIYPIFFILVVQGLAGSIYVSIILNITNPEEFKLFSLD